MNKKGIYVAFNGGGDTKIDTGDIGHYRTMQAWDANENINFEFIDSHDKTRDVRDDSKCETLKPVLRERLNLSKMMILFLSEETKYNNRPLNFEVEYAIKNDIPIYVIYGEKNNQCLTGRISSLDANDNKNIKDFACWGDGIKDIIFSWIKRN